MTSKNNTQFNKPLKAILGLGLAWIVPGAGHAFVGRPERGIIIFITIGATFWGGVAMGGVMTVDYHGQKWWFAAEMLTGMHGLVGWRNESKQMRKLEPEIQAGMEEKGIYLENHVRKKRQELVECNRQIAQLRSNIAAATTREEKEMLREDLRTRSNARSSIEGELIRAHAQLNSLRSAHIVKVLAKKNLALVAPMATVARAYAGVAGLLNLMCMFDVVMLALIGTFASTKPSNEEDNRK